MCAAQIFMTVQTVHTISEPLERQGPQCVRGLDSANGKKNTKIATIKKEGMKISGTSHQEGELRREKKQQTQLPLTQYF